ncbi:hypothetical protein D5086_031210 [Populus alba]|uniref:Uncharacterized protein n=3 Tax=Populus TaxID=3689 RepID=A0ACC4AQN3_POPAL|nr:ribosome biogenesis protein BOP1 homolog [Populus alba]XP_034898992.1 ribosome biogenesis protein BOP1 homolog [Populus alba]XP_034898993.1 ribosome biogenesis protein BOP1 homolog [Populus alba]XP_034898994.1 ribosome biogenesis protein BOP1 homolog [Populus alba]KAJ7002588.1 ribosome biogenesis protein BOP1 [Populus alba x Populus x berolinensis]TKS15582.1 hypothetical protein D5086_0000032770 [Populus alba]
MGASKKESVEVEKREEKKKSKKTQPTKKEKLGTEESLLHKKQEDTATDYKEFSEDYKSAEESEAGDSESSGDEGFHDTGSNEGLANEGQSEDSEPDLGGEESDSSEDEVAPRNTVGDVPLEWYRDEKHIGYGIAGKKLKKKETR